jgi:hypothetical protein
MKVAAHEIKHALSLKHREDFFLTEVKNGSTWFNDELAIIDALAIKKSWTKPCITGYEIKVSRQDFLNDDKWPVYKNYCHRFYFACPTGLIQPDEIPDDVGLVWYNPDKKSLFTKKKSKFREIEMPTDMFYYIILSRLENEKHPFFSSQREYFEQYVNDKISKRELGWKVSSKMVNELRELEKQIARLEMEKSKFEEDQKLLNAVLEIMKKHGLRANKWNLERELDQALSVSVPPQFMDTLQTIHDATKRLCEFVELGGNK